jgi:hypothetical protein
MQAVLGLHALVRHTRAHHFGKPVDVQRVHVELLLDLLAQIPGPRLGAEDADLQ